MAFIEDSNTRTATTALWRQVLCPVCCGIDGAGELDIPMEAILVPETANIVPIYLTLAAFVFILILDGNRWICQRVHLCTRCTKPAHISSLRQLIGRTMGTRVRR